MSQPGRVPPPRPRRDRLVEDSRHDPYRAPGKPGEDAVCRGCGLGVRSGRWQRVSAPWAPRETLCPACQRAEGPYPAGFFCLQGDFLGEHREEIESLMRHVEAREEAEHPLQRVIDIEDQGDGTVLVTTTGSHLARALGQAVQRAYGGSLQLRYADQENLVRAVWER